MDYSQIKQIKEQHHDSLLFVRIGDFYEAFAEDAVKISKELELTLTTRSFKGEDERIPMTGIPYHVADLYIKKLVEKGYKVAVAEQPSADKVAKSEATNNIVNEPTKNNISKPTNTNIKENKKMDNYTNITAYSEEECAEIVGQSKAYFDELLSSGNLKKLLIVIGQNGRYTLNNNLFMLSCAPDLTVAKNMVDWSDLGRSIIPQSNSIEIMAPIKEERIARSDDGEEPLLDDKGQPKKYTALNGFKPTYVFDISQTMGRDYEPFKITSKISEEQKRTILNGVRNELMKRGYKIDFVDAEKLNEGETGKVDRTSKRVQIKKGMDNYSTTLAVLHHSATALSSTYRHREFEGLKGSEAYELEAACMDCILAAHFGMDTSKFDFSFTKVWDNEERTAFYNNANLACATSTKLMESISRAFEYKAEKTNQQETATNDELLDTRPSLFRGIASQTIAEAS